MSVVSRGERYAGEDGRVAGMGTSIVGLDEGGK